MNQQKQTLIFNKFACPSCGGKALEKISTDVYGCQYCRNHFIISKGNGEITSIEIDTQGIIDKPSPEPAINKIQSELDELLTQKSSYLKEWNRLSTIHNEKPNYKRKVQISGFVLLVSFILFIIAISADIMALGLTSMLIFIIFIFILIGISINSSKRKILENKYYEMAAFMLPLTNKIKTKQEILHKYNQNAKQ